MVCHKTFVSLITFVETPYPEAYRCRELLLMLQNSLRHSEVPHNLSQCTWTYTLLEFSSCLPSDQT